MKLFWLATAHLVNAQNQDPTLRSLDVEAAQAKKDADEKRLAQQGDNPVTRVVKLLKDLQAKLGSDADAELEAYNRYSCWCENTTREKATSIAAAKEEISTLSQKILELRGKIATLTSEIQKLNARIEENMASQDSAVRLRQKQSQQYQSEKAETEETLGALRKAITALTGAGTKTSLISSSVSSVIRNSLTRRPLSETVVKNVAEFLKINSRQDYYEEKAQASQAFSPQSATIIGILKDMFATFSSDLQKASKDEAVAQFEHDEIMATLQEQLLTLQTTLAGKESAKSKAVESESQTNQKNEDTTDQLNNDVDFFDAAQESCTKKSQQWDERQRLRREEVHGVRQALKLLTSDDARKLFDDSIQRGFAMEPATGSVSFLEVTTPRLRAFNELRKVARKTHSLRLAALAASLKGSGHFDLVITEINNMMQNLNEEQQSDNKHRDWCRDNRHEREEMKKHQEWEVRNDTAHIKKLTVKIEKLSAEIQETTDAINQVDTDVTNMTNTRDNEHGQYVAAKADDAAAVELLETVIEKLSAYNRNNQVPEEGVQRDERPVSFFQRKQEPEEDKPVALNAPQADFAMKDSRAQEGNAIVSLLTMIKEDLEREISSGEAGEADANKAFHSAKAAAAKLRASLVKKRQNLNTAKTDTQDERRITREHRDDEVQPSLDNTRSLLATMKPSCDWIQSKWEIRYKARTEERLGLEKAKSILAGAQSFITRNDSRALSNMSFSHLQ